MIGIIGTPLTQWDVGRSVEIKNIVATHVDLANKGDSKAVRMELVDGQAEIPNYLLQTGKQLCVYAVANGVTIERKTFFVIQRERPENYVYDDDQRNYIYELIQSAEDATETAKQATQNANEAADKANQAAKSWVIMGEVKGESMVIDDAIDQTFAGFRIFGKTTQDGVPSPEAPVDLVSVENPTVSVNEQSMLVPYTLRGIPVSSGGNYTDANGQQWICDEVDFARGVYVQRINSLILNGSEQWLEYKYDTQYYGFFVGDYLDSGQNRALGLCNQFSVSRLTDGSVWIGVSGNTALYVITREWYDKGINAWKSHLSTNPLRIMYPQSTPIETPLSEEDLAAYATLHTSRYGTTVSNDKDAYMDIHYHMDAKKYIDSLVGSSAGLVNATVE